MKCPKCGGELVEITIDKIQATFVDVLNDEGKVVGEQLSIPQKTQEDGYGCEECGFQMGV